MLTNHDACTFYSEFLDKLREKGTGALARDIELTVLRGALRAEDGSSAKAPTFQKPLSSREALVVALRMFLAALDPAFQLPYVRKILGACRSDDESAAFQITWALDRLEAREEPDHELLPQTDPRALDQLEKLPEVDPATLTELRGLVERLASFVAELETEGD